MKRSRQSLGGDSKMPPPPGDRQAIPPSETARLRSIVHDVAYSGHREGAGGMVLVVMAPELWARIRAEKEALKPPPGWPNKKTE